MMRTMIRAVLALVVIAAAVAVAPSAPHLEPAQAAVEYVDATPTVTLVSYVDTAGVELRGTWKGVVLADGTVELRLDLTDGAVARAMADIGHAPSGDIPNAFTMTLRPATDSGVTGSLSYEYLRNGALLTAPGWRHLRNARQPRTLYTRGLTTGT